MSMRDKFYDQFKPVHRVIGIVLIPIILDLANYLLYQKIFRTEYLPAHNLLNLKIGLVSAPPSVRSILEDFPSPLFQANNGSVSGIVNQLTLFNVLLLLSATLILSFLHSGYLGVLAESGRRPMGWKDFFVLGNQFWLRFLVLQVLGLWPLILMLINPELVFLGLINVVFVYVQYAIVVDEGSIKENFQRGIGFLLQNLKLTLIMAIYFGLIFSFLGIFIHVLAGLGRTGIIIAIVLTAYLGAVVNKTVLEIYREKSRGEQVNPEIENTGNLDSDNL